MQVADPGQLAYAASVINAEWKAMANDSITAQDYFGAWAQTWWALADEAYNQASDHSSAFNWQSKRDLFQKAANYYFTGMNLVSRSFVANQSLQSTQIMTSCICQGRQALPFLPPRGCSLDSNQQFMLQDSLLIQLAVLKIGCSGQKLQAHACNPDQLKELAFTSLAVQPLNHNFLMALLMISCCAAMPAARQHPMDDPVSFAGLWPFPMTEEAQDALSKMRDSLRNAFEVSQGVEVIYFNVSYNGSLTLPGFFVTPDASKQLPLVIQGTGFDFPKEVCS